MIVSEFLLYAMMFVFGMCMFSFYNVVIYRVPKHIQFVKGRSFCPGEGICRMHAQPSRRYQRCAGDSPCNLHGQKRRKYRRHQKNRNNFSYVCNTHSLIHVHADELAAVIITFAYISLLTIIAFIDADTMEISNVMVVLVLMLGVINTVLSGIETRKANSEPAMTSFTVLPRQQNNIKANAPVPHTGWLHVYTRPRNVKISPINVSETQTLPVGTYQLEFTKKGYITQNLEYTVRRNETTLDTVSLQRVIYVKPIAFYFGGAFTSPYAFRYQRHLGWRVLSSRCAAQLHVRPDGVRCSLLGW